MELIDLHCDTPLSRKPVVSGKTLSGIKRAGINFAFCFLKGESRKVKEAYVRKFLARVPHFGRSLEYVFSLEGLSAFSGTEEALDFIRTWGIGIVSLVWNRDNRWAGGCMGKNRGLTAEGRSLIRELNAMDIAVDISHASERTSEQVFEKASVVLATHSNFREVHEHPRNIRKWQAASIKRKGGLIGLNFFLPFLGNGRPLEDFFRHIDYALSEGFGECIAIGSDFDGMHKPLIEDPSGLWDLYISVKERYGKKTADGLFYLNAKRNLKISKRFAKVRKKSRL